MRIIARGQPHCSWIAFRPSVVPASFHRHQTHAVGDLIRPVRLGREAQTLVFLPWPCFESDAKPVVRQCPAAPARAERRPQGGRAIRSVVQRDGEYPLLSLKAVAHDLRIDLLRRKGFLCFSTSADRDKDDADHAHGLRASQHWTAKACRPPPDPGSRRYGWLPCRRSTREDPGRSRVCLNKHDAVLLSACRYRSRGWGEIASRRPGRSCHR